MPSRPRNNEISRGARYLPHIVSHSSGSRSQTLGVCLLVQKGLSKTADGGFFRTQPCTISLVHLVTFSRLHHHNKAKPTRSWSFRKSKPSRPTMKPFKPRSTTQKRRSDPKDTDWRIGRFFMFTTTGMHTDSSDCRSTAFINEARRLCVLSTRCVH